MATLLVKSNSLAALRGFVAGIEYVNDGALDRVGEIDEVRQQVVFLDRDSDDDREIQLSANGFMV